MNYKMKILLINTNYGGGAAIACRRQLKALQERGYDAHLLVLEKPLKVEEKNVISIEEIITQKYNKTYFVVLKLINRIFNRINFGFNKEVYINGPKSLFRIDELEIFKEADIVHLHWVPKILSYKNTFVNKEKLFFWTLHDMNPFTGGNHYTKDYDYSKYSTLLKSNISLKKKHLKGVNLTVISPSEWLKKKAEESEVFKGFDVVRLPNCLDLSVFKPTNKEDVRKKIGLTFQDKKYILFVAESTEDPRKGMDRLLSVLNSNKYKSEVCLLIMGNTNKENNEYNGMSVFQFGFKNVPSEIVDCYNAADFFIIPSVEDNLPNTVLESLACGVPVLGYNIGGIPEMIHDESLGFLCDINDDKRFVENVEKLVKKEDYSQFQLATRKSAEENYSEEIIISKLVKLYKSK